MEIANLRGIARLVNHAAFKKLSVETNQSAYIRQLKKYANWDKIQDDLKPKKLEELIAYGYQLLVDNYRNEYVYKSTLLNNFILHNYCLDDTIVLNEFRINESIADVVLVNGTNKVFEIKTELDTLERFESQVNDYFKAFSEVYLVTHYTVCDKYAQSIDPRVGIIVYAQDNSLQEIRPAEKVLEHLDTRTMMASLRKPEYVRMVKNIAGFVPSSTPVFLYQECLNVLLQFSPEEVQRVYHKILKERISETKNVHIRENLVPNYLNYSYYIQNINKKSYLTLQNNLNKKV